MENRLGVSESKLFDIERKLVSLKLNLLDEYITFNTNILSFEYIKKLHNFLFSDLYFDKELKTRELDVVELNNIETLFVFLEYTCTNNKINVDEIVKYVYMLWDMQLFQNGNTRTLIAYLYILDKAFMLNLNIDLNVEINNKTTFLELENAVNQKRLTKTK